MKLLHYIKILITRFNNLIDMIGIDRRQFHDHFKIVEKSTPYPVVYGGGEEIRKKMLVQYNAYAIPKTDKGKDIFRNYRGKILVPDRIRWNTAHVIALYSQEPVLSNIFYAVKLEVPQEIEEYSNKALVLWFNTVWGLLIVLTSRQETEGAWSSLKIGQWRLLPVLNVNELDNDTLKRLANIFDKYSNKPLKRIQYQFNPQNPDPVRLGLDLEFLKALHSDLDEEFVKNELFELYRRIHTAMKIWIGD